MPKQDIHQFTSYRCIDFDFDIHLSFKKDVHQFQNDSMLLGAFSVFLCRSRCDRYGDAVLDMKKESKNNVGEVENVRNNNAREKQSYSLEWTTFEDDENFHPNLLAHHDNSCRSSSINPFAQ